jgi:nucleoside phosphorylase
MATQRFAFQQFCVLCAKSEEAAAVLDVFDDRFTRPTARRVDSDHIFEVPSAEQARRVMVATCEGMGHVDAAVRTAEILAVNRPSVMVFVGTAASLRPEEIQLGDVVVPRKALYRSYEKISQSGQKDYESRIKRSDFRETFFDDNALIAEMNTLRLTGGANNIVADLSRKTRSLTLEKGSGTEVVIGGETYSLREPKVHVDVDIISCGMVVDSISYRDFLIEVREGHSRKADVIDMESYGFFQALATAKKRGGCEGLMVRGISDYAGRKQQTEASKTESRPQEWKEKAVRNAALVVAELFTSLSARPLTGEKPDPAPLPIAG